MRMGDTATVAGRRMGDTTHATVAALRAQLETKELELVRAPRLCRCSRVTHEVDNEVLWETVQSASDRGVGEPTPATYARASELVFILAWSQGGEWQ